jgi:hypothetical protein
VLLALSFSFPSISIPMRKVGPRYSKPVVISVLPILRLFWRFQQMFGPVRRGLCYNQLPTIFKIPSLLLII